MTAAETLVGVRKIQKDVGESSSYCDCCIFTIDLIAFASVLVKLDDEDTRRGEEDFAV